MPEARDELLALNQRLLDAIAAGDWATYTELCADDLTAFEPEACGQLIEGLPFHQFYFNLPNRGQRKQVTMAAPRVRVMGEVAVVTYVRVNQSAGPDAMPQSTASDETRVWQLQAGRWRHVHFHRSPVGG
jgi:ketosteroid isomerase-like protein